MIVSETILGLDTTLMAMSAAVTRGGDVLSNQTIPDIRDQAERLPGLITTIITQAGVTLSDIDRIAVTIGPGGFSGLRVGLSHARGMAAVLGCPVIGIGTLEALAASALNAENDRPVIAAIDARRGEIYVQAFEKGLVPLSAPQALSPYEAAQAYGSLGARIVGTGRKLLLDAMHPEHACIDGEQDYPNAADIAQSALGRSEDEAPLNPLYIRPPDAKLPSSAPIVHS